MFQLHNLMNARMNCESPNKAYSCCMDSSAQVATPLDASADLDLGCIPDATAELNTTVTATSWFDKHN